MTLNNLSAIEFEGALVGVGYLDGDEVVGIPISLGNIQYQQVLDATIAEGASCWATAVPPQVQADADAKLFNNQLTAYQAAVARLAEYIVADGRAEVTEMQPTGEKRYNPDTDTMEDVMDVVVIAHAVDPVEPTVEQTTVDADGNVTTTTIENPLITQDNEERAAAQAVVDSTPQAVKDAA